MGSTEVRARVLRDLQSLPRGSAAARSAASRQPAHATSTCQRYLRGETSRRTPSRAQPERGPARTPNAKGPALLPAQLPTLFVLYMYDVLSRFRENEFHKKRRSAWSDVRHVSRATT